MLYEMPRAALRCARCFHGRKLSIALCFWKLTGFVGALLRLKTDETACTWTVARPVRGAEAFGLLLRSVFCGRMAKFMELPRRAAIVYGVGTADNKYSNDELIARCLVAQYAEWRSEGVATVEEIAS
jgi:hypothetical protein